MNRLIEYLGILLAVFYFVRIVSGIEKKPPAPAGALTHNGNF
jgi:hypothetical protein